MQPFLWAALLLGDFLLVMLFIGGNAAAYVPPWQWWALQLIAPVVPYLGLGVIGAAACALLWKRWGLLALHVVVLLAAVVGPALAPPGRAAHDVPDGAPGLRLISFNARGAVLWQYEAFRSLLNTTRPHVVAFQELIVELQEGAERLKGGGAAPPILSEVGLSLSLPTDDRYAPTAQPVFSRLDTAGPTRILAGQTEEGLWESGGVSRSVYTWNGHPIAIYSVHLHSFSSERPWRGSTEDRGLAGWLDAIRAYRTDFRVRAEQARRLREMLDAEPYPFVVCGDLNSTPHNWVYAHLASGLQDAFRQAGTGSGQTYHAAFPLFRIDYIFASEEWVVRSARVDRTLSSDHFPVIAELVLRTPAGVNSPRYSSQLETP